MKFFKTIGKNSLPDFQKTKNKELTNGLKLDSTAYYKNGKKKAKYYRFSDNFPLYFVKEFDSLISGTYSQGFRLISNYKINQIGYNPSINSNPDVTKYGYWEYFVDEEKVKHELWASMLQEQFEWYPSGQLKFKAEFASYNKQKCHYKYLENGDIKEEFLSQTTKRISVIRSYNYSSSGKLILINTYSSPNGIMKKELLKRELFYPSGKLKMAENFVGTYTIKYYKEDGAERN